MRALNISIVGATGAVGAELIKLLEASQIPVNQLRLLASRNSAGHQVRFRDEICFVEALDETGVLRHGTTFARSPLGAHLLRIHVSEQPK